ncbi:proline--tRNA ligase, partial [Paenibacillus sepulcri]|nr:proline--tRNA ligase [Paenibacillus sepulcri]
GRVDELYKELKKAGVRVKVDDRSDVSPGWKFNEYEMRGVPLRLELGPRDMENGQVVLVSRLTGEKRMVAQADLVVEVERMLAEIQSGMLERAKQF